MVVTKRSPATSPVTIVVAGDPVAKGRPRMTRTGRAYTPAKTRQYETYARLVAQQEMQGRRLLEGALHMKLRVDLAIPSSWSKKKQQAALIGEVMPCVKPDLDNFLKAIADSLAGVVFADDKQVVSVTATKRYSQTPKMVVTIAPEVAA